MEDRQQPARVRVSSVGVREAQAQCGQWVHVTLPGAGWGGLLGRVRGDLQQCG